MPFAESIGVEWAWIIPALSASAFVLTLLLGRVLPRQGAFITIGATGLGFLLFWYVLSDLLAIDSVEVLSLNWISVGGITIGWTVIVDRLAVIMLGFVTFVALLVQVYSLGYMRSHDGVDDPRLGWYFAVHAMFASAMLALLLAGDLVFLYVAWELVGLGSYLLIGFWFDRRAAAEAAKKAFITTRIGDVGLLIGIILLFRATGSFDIREIFRLVRDGLADGTISQATVNVSVVLIFLGAMGKSAQFPFHVWLPDAMEGPTPVSALIHAATMVAAGVFLVARMMPLFVLAPDVLLVVAGVGLFTFAFAGTLALVMTDLKRVLAYSTVSHLGLMMLSLGSGAVAAAIFHLLAHGVAKAALFLGAGNLMHTAERTDIWKMGGLRRRMPATAATFTLAAASLAGIPLLAGFFSKDEILFSVLEHRNPVFLVLALVAVALSALYMARIAFAVFYGKLGPDNEAIHESPPVMTLPLVPLAGLAAGIGLLAFGWTDAYSGFGSFLMADQPFTEPGEGFHLEPWLAGVSGALAIGAVAFGWLVYGRGTVSHRRLAARFATARRIAVRKYYLDETFQWAIDRVVLATGRLVAAFDRVVVNDGAVDGSAVTVMLSALRLRYLQTGRLSNYGTAMALGVIGLGLVWWLGLL